MKIVNDGAIEGWFVSLCITVVIFVTLVAGLFNEKICERWVKIGGVVSQIYLGQFAAWLAYRTFKNRSENGKE